jgi:hypothetical protein
VVCGFVTAFGTNTGVNNATVRLRSSSGAVVASVTTANDVQSGGAGFYKITVPNGAALPTLIDVVPPPAQPLRADRASRRLRSPQVRIRACSTS